MLPDFIKNIIFIIIGIFGIGLLIGFHELGHFIFCKIFKVRTPSFSIGMGPKLLTKKIGETEFSISAFPIGGYVEIAGMQEVGQGEQAESKREDHYSFKSKPFYQKLFILSGGIIFNFLLAYIFFIALFMTGMPKTKMLFPTVVAAVRPGSAAEKYNLQPNDKIIAVNNISTPNIIEFEKNIQSIPNEKATLTIERNKQEIKIEVITDSCDINGKKVGILGIELDKTEVPPQSIFDSFKNGIQATNKSIVLTFDLFKSIFKKRETENIAGPIMIISIIKDSMKQGIKIFLLILAFISINLAILNLLPIPIMDGGQILFAAIEAIIRRPISDNIRIVIGYISWIGLIFLLVYFSITDIFKLFFKK